MSGSSYLRAIHIRTSPRAVKMNLANEGLEARKKEEEVVARKRKAEEDKAWEGTSSSPSPPLSSSPIPLECGLVIRVERVSCRQLAIIQQRLEEEEKDQGRNPWMRCV